MPDFDIGAGIVQGGVLVLRKYTLRCLGEGGHVCILLSGVQKKYTHTQTYTDKQIHTDTEIHTQIHTNTQIHTDKYRDTNTDAS